MTSDIPNAHSHFLHWEFFISGLVWIFYSMLLLYLFHEHNKKFRYPQNIIILLLAIGAIFRTVWFFLYTVHGRELYEIIFNRIAILCQFSALSVLVLMWSRAVKVMPFAIKKLSQKARKIFHFPSDEGLTEMYEKRIRLYHRVAIIMNVVAWAFILGSLASSSDTWYRINITALSALCMIEAIVILVVGVNTGYKLQREIAPIYVSATGLPAGMVEPKQTCIGTTCRLFSFIYRSNSGNRGLQIQKQILQTLLTTATILSVLFLIRSLVFWFSQEIYEWSPDFDYVCYPWFFYNVPELVPTLVLAKGISPPDGILRRVSAVRLFASRSPSATSSTLPLQNRTGNGESVGSLSVVGRQSDVSGLMNKSLMSENGNQSFIGSYAGSVCETSDNRYAGSVIMTLGDVVRNTMTLDGEEREDRPKNAHMNDASRHWKQYVDDDGLSEYSEYDIDDFVYRTTSFDNSES